MKRGFYSCFELSLILVLMLFSTGCNKKNPAKEKKTSVTIGFSIDTLIIERWQTDLETFRKYASEQGANVIVQNASNSLENQISQIEYLIDQNVDVLVIVPKEAGALTEVIQKARQKNIPVISYDRLITGTDIDLYLSVDTEYTGELLARRLLEEKDSGGYFCILGPEEDYNMHFLLNGVHNALSGSKVSLDLVYYTPEWNYDLSYRKMSELLDSNLLPDAVIAGNDAVAESVLQAISEHKLSSKIPVVAQDADKLALRRIQSGTQTATVYKPIEELASMCAKAAVALGKGDDIGKLIPDLETVDNGFGNVKVWWCKGCLIDSENVSSFF